jgi:hypothetical protein
MLETSIVLEEVSIDRFRPGYAGIFVNGDSHFGSRKIGSLRRKKVSRFYHGRPYRLSPRPAVGTGSTVI